MANTEDERTYCEVCFENFDDDGFDYRFDTPICHKCGEGRECDDHTWVLQLNIANTPTRNFCEMCGATEDADPHDIAEQLRLLNEIDKED